MPLRPELYTRLKHCSLFGGHVRIANEGEAMSAVIVREALSGRKRLHVRSPGEYYCVNCPFCNDTRQRLSINHMWGYLHPETKDRHLWLCHCHNEGCIKSYDRQKVLYNEVFSDFHHEDRDVVLTGNRPTSLAPTKADWPGLMVLIKDLAPSHPARKYLEGRGYDAQWLSDVMDVRLCLEHFDRFYMAAGRIIIPVYMEGELVGWQARHVGDPRDKEVPKYWSMPGWKKTQCLYNFDNAKKHEHVVVCEGPTDVWSVGDDAVALFGKTASTTQLDLITRHWKKVFICLDGDAPEDAQHLYDALGSRIQEKVLVTLPSACDPGNMPQPTLRNMIFGSYAGVNQ
jgi:hypothetical protein